jgi:hypothetical protein
MSRLRLKYLLSAAVIAVFSFGVAGAASAAPVSGAAKGIEGQAMAPHSQALAVHWVRHGHHRVWVPDHYHHH